jgi:hypothetical protein
MENEFEERARKEKTPIQYRIYKGIKGTLGALRFTLKRPYTNVTSKKAEGFVFLEVAPAIGQNVYDWENQKITMALSVNDISKIILFMMQNYDDVAPVNIGNTQNHRIDCVVGKIKKI